MLLLCGVIIVFDNRAFFGRAIFYRVFVDAVSYLYVFVFVVLFLFVCV